MNVISKQLIKIAREANLYIDQLNNKLKVLYIDKDNVIKLKQSQCKFGSIKQDQRAKSDYVFKIKTFVQLLQKDGQLIYDTVNKIKQDKKDNKNANKEDDEIYYDQDTGKFIGLKITDEQLRKTSIFYKTLKKFNLLQDEPELEKSLKQVVDFLNENVNKKLPNKMRIKFEDLYENLTVEMDKSWQNMEKKLNPSQMMQMEKLYFNPIHERGLL